ncbi:MAG: VanZ family protein [Anaerolineae bacterium]|nr:VanZ family protein [Anaerolineae bacterium]
MGPVLLWMAAIYVVSAQPTLPTIGETWLDRTVKAAAHAGEYAVLAVLMARPALAGGGWLSRKQALVVLGLCFLYSLSDEYHQSFVAGRMADWADVAADTAGAFLSVVALSADGPAGLLRRLDPLLRARCPDRVGE